MRRHHRPNSGFTLAELLVAATLMSIAMGAVYGLLYSTIGAWRQVDQGVNPGQQARLALTLLQRDIESASIKAEHLFEGDGDSLTLFTVTEPMNVEDSKGARLMRVRYRYKPGEHELIREEAMVKAALPNRPQPGKKVNQDHIELSDRKKFVIARNVEDFELHYLWVPLPEHVDAKSPPPPVEPISVKRHKEDWGLPQGIEIQITISDPDKKTEQEFRLVISLPMRKERLSIKMLKDMLGSAA